MVIISKILRNNLSS